MKKEKQLLLDEIKEQIEQYGSFVIAQYTKVTSNSMNNFRGVIANLGGDVQMIRKTVFLKAAEQAGIDLKKQDLEGHISIVFAGVDPIETAKAVFKYSKENDNTLKVLGGRLDGELYRAKDVEMLSTLPGKDEMRAQLLSVFEAPLSHTLGTVDAILTSILHCLDNKAKKEEESQ